MTAPVAQDRFPAALQRHGGLRLELASHGALVRARASEVDVNAFQGNECEGGPANLWLRLRERGAVAHVVPLLGPCSPLAFTHHADAMLAHGRWRELEIALSLRLADDGGAWYWQVELRHHGAAPCEVDLVHLQDLALAPYGAIRLNEAYVSHYIDLCPLLHPQHGWLLAARQNQAVGGRHPWLLAGVLGRGAAYATDALQLLGTALRGARRAPGLWQALPSQRLQHEHAAIALQTEPLTLAPGASVRSGFFLALQADHPAASGPDDLAAVDALVAQAPQAASLRSDGAPSALRPARNLFAHAPVLAVQAFDAGELAELFAAPRRHEERDADGALLSFFHGEDAHVVLRAKELAVQRPHGHILRSGSHLVPDEQGLTSTVWMHGVFHSMVTQGHVSINRFLSTQRGWLGQFRSQGQRVFVEIGGRWHLLGTPSAFEMRPQACRWLYKLAGGLIEVAAQARADAHALQLRVRVIQGPARAMLVTHHVALAGDDGAAGGLARWRRDEHGVFVAVPPSGDLASRFPGGGFRLQAGATTLLSRVGGDEMLFEDGRSRALPFVCLQAAPTSRLDLVLRGELLSEATAASDTGAPAVPSAPTDGAGLHLRLRSTDTQAAQLAEIAPWLMHNALVHYLSPRGLEQYSGGGWGTRDVCQGPLEMLLALGQPAPVRDLLQRVFRNQNADGDWPQWFMFFERERAIRAGDAHGDIVLWPLLALARYLLASGDAALLDEPLPFFDDAPAPLWAHVQRALRCADARRIPGTALVSYGHGDWNDSLQPVDAASRERLCSSWTVTLHHQVLGTLARALHALGREADARALREQAQAVRADFERLLVADGVVAGYARFDPGRERSLLLHPQDRSTGVHYSLLPMMHAVIDDMLPPALAQTQLQAIEAHLLAPDGARLFDRPMPYRGGPQQLFQRAESSAFFGREIGVMYMHAHLRYAEMLAHLGQAERFVDALSLAHPIGLTQRVPGATLRQANCYYSSSDAAFGDRYEAARRYDDVKAGRVAFDGGWRIYSSGPGIAIGLFVERLLGVRQQHDTLVLDPVLPQRLDGLQAELPIAGRPVTLTLHVGARGHGVQAATLNGQPLAFTRGTNPYRTGAAEVPMDLVRRALQAALQPQGNRLDVQVG